MRASGLGASILLASACIGPAAAENLALEYQAVMHVREVHALAVLDRPEHQVGVARFRGLAIFPDEGVIVHRYEGWLDLVEGSGAFHGYASWAFEDGSVLRAAYSGEATQSGPEDVRVEADFAEFEGTGRFQGVEGTGGFSGRRVDALEEGGATHVSGTLNLTLAD